MGKIFVSQIQLALCDVRVLIGQMSLNVICAAALMYTSVVNLASGHGSNGIKTVSRISVPPRRIPKDHDILINGICMLLVDKIYRSLGVSSWAVPKLKAREADFRVVAKLRFSKNFSKNI